MPEGDTVFRAARRMNLALSGGTVKRFESVYPHLTRIDHESPLAGRVVEGVTAIGKHHLIAFSGDLTLRTHMRMNGSWHLYRTGEPWRRRSSEMRIFVETDEWQAVGFSIPVAEFLESGAAADGPALSILGPDLLGEGFDGELALERLAAQGDREIAESLLDQRVMAGIGNVYKSELLFMKGIHPFRRTDDVPRPLLQSLIQLSRKMLRLNVPPDATPGSQGGLRWTTGRLNPAERLYVYGRKGKACRRCGAAIELAKQGPHARLTYWCPRCQK